MKYWCFLLAATFTFSSDAAAKSERPVYLISGGATLTSQPRDLKDNWPTGWNICAGVGVPLTKYITVRTTASFSRYPLQTGRKVYRIVGGSSNVRVEGDASAAFAVSSQLQVGLVNRAERVRLMPYGFIGPCFHYQRIGAHSQWTQGGVHIGSEWITISPERDIPDIGLEVGVGFSCLITQRFGVFVEALRTVGFSSDPSCGAWTPIRAGLTFR